jgi:hypothetical protein
MLNVDIPNAYCTDSLGHAEHCPCTEANPLWPTICYVKFCSLFAQSVVPQYYYLFLYCLFGCLKSNLKELGMAMAAPLKHSLYEGWCQEE